MPLTSGDNTVRVAGLIEGRDGVYDVYQFNLVNLKGETHGIAYKSAAGVVPHKLIRDLLELRRRNLWFTVYLKEVRGMLSIFTIKEPRQPQNELWRTAQKFIPQTARKLQELTGESRLVN